MIRGVKTLHWPLPGTFILQYASYFNWTHCLNITEDLDMNCFLEAMATLWMTARRQVITEPIEEEVVSAHEGLEQCRRNMEGRERELQVVIMRLSEEALTHKRTGDVLTARAKLIERRRCNKRLERLRHGIELVDTQIDAIKTSELDKEIMLTLKASTSAMRKAGINLGVQEVETVMSEIDEQMREVQDITDVLSNPLLSQGGSISTLVEDSDLDAELDLLEAVITTTKPSSAETPNSMLKPLPVASPEMAPSDPWQPRSAGPAAAVV